jgi:hypothetical protein
MSNELFDPEAVPECDELGKILNSLNPYSDERYDWFMHSRNLERRARLAEFRISNAKSFLEVFFKKQTGDNSLANDLLNILDGK